MARGVPGSTPVCSIEGCSAPAQGRGWCSKHYGRWQRNGDPLMVKPPHREVTLPNLADLCLTYRQLDHWTTLGYLTANAANPGSGRRRTWSTDQMQIAEGMARLSRIGLTLELAHRVATGHGDVGDGISITIQPRDVE